MEGKVFKFIIFIPIKLDSECDKMIKKSLQKSFNYQTCGCVIGFGGGQAEHEDDFLLL